MSAFKENEMHIHIHQYHQHQKSYQIAYIAKSGTRVLWQKKLATKVSP
jgi:hypothetical protein